MKTLVVALLASLLVNSLALAGDVTPSDCLNDYIHKSMQLHEVHMVAAGFGVAIAGIAAVPLAPAGTMAEVYLIFSDFVVFVPTGAFLIAGREPSEKRYPNWAGRAFGILSEVENGSAASAELNDFSEKISDRYRKETGDSYTSDEQVRQWIRESLLVGLNDGSFCTPNSRGRVKLKRPGAIEKFVLAHLSPVAT